MRFPHLEQLVGTLEKEISLPEGDVYAIHPEYTPADLEFQIEVAFTRSTDIYAFFNPSHLTAGLEREDLKTITSYIYKKTEDELQTQRLKYRSDYDNLIQKVLGELPKIHPNVAVLLPLELESPRAIYKLVSNCFFRSN